MNLAIATTSARTWKAVKTHYIVAIAGASLALASAVGATSLSFDWGRAGADSPRPSIQVERSHTSLVLYLVGSQEQADFAAASEAQAAWERASSGISEPDQQVLIMKVTTPNDEAFASEILDTWAAGEPDRATVVVDLR